MKTAPAALTGLPVYAFRVGQTYSTRVAGDADCVFSIVVLARSSATVSVRSNLCEVATLRVELWQGTESVKVLPGYHQSPIIRLPRRGTQMLAEIGASAVALLDDLISSLVVLIAVASTMLWLGLRSRRHGK